MRSLISLSLLVLVLLACGEETPTMPLSAPVAELESDPVPVPVPVPVLAPCVDQMNDSGLDVPICDALAPLRVVFLGTEPVSVAAGGNVELRFGLAETSGFGMFRYPFVAVTSSHPAASVDRVVQLYGISGCETFETPIVLSVQPSVASGTEITVEAEVMSLGGTCEEAHRIAVSVLVL